MEREQIVDTLRLNAKIEAGRQALGIVGRSKTDLFMEAFEDFKKAYGFLKKEFEGALSTNGVADSPDDPVKPNA